MINNQDIHIYKSFNDKVNGKMWTLIQIGVFTEIGKRFNPFVPNPKVPHYFINASLSLHCSLGLYYFGHFQKWLTYLPLAWYKSLCLLLGHVMVMLHWYACIALLSMKVCPNDSDHIYLLMVMINFSYMLKVLAIFLFQYELKRFSKT